jgi:hypothetical protein
MPVGALDAIASEAEVAAAIAQHVVDEGHGGGAHPDLPTHDALGLATDAELAAHAAGPHGGAHPDLATHDALGLATDAEAAAHAALVDGHHTRDHATRHEPAGADAMAVDAAAGTGSLRTLGSGATQSAAGNHGHDHGGLAGLSDDDHTIYALDSQVGAANGIASLDAGTKLPIAQLPQHATRHEPAGADAMAVDAAAGTGSLRTIGTGALQAAAGNHGPHGGSLSYQEADRATDLALSTTFADAVSLSLAAGTWLILGQTSAESTSTTQGIVSVRLRNTTDGVTYSHAEAEVDSALPDRQSLFVHAVVVLAATKTVALQGRQSAGTSHLIGPANEGGTETKVTRMTAVKVA